MILIYGYCFLIGASCGSFVYAATWRYLHQLDFVYGRSSCPNCHHTLAWYDLIPVVSWLCLRGKCRYCHAFISPSYLLYELGIGVSALLCLRIYGFTCEGIWIFVIILILISMAMIDRATMIIPNGLQLLLIIPIMALSWLHPEMTLENHLSGALSISGFMMLMNQWKKGSFGGGDIKLMFLCGWLLGCQRIIMAMVIAVWTAGLYAIYLLCLRRAQRDTRIAFAPYLCIGVIFVLFHGPIVLSMVPGSRIL